MLVTGHIHTFIPAVLKQLCVFGDWCVIYVGKCLGKLYSRDEQILESRVNPYVIRKFLPSANNYHIDKGTPVTQLIQSFNCTDQGITCE
jgi:hypothetical protein